MRQLREIGNRIRKDLKSFCLVAALFLVCYQTIHYLFDAFCPMLVFTGIPCAGCGLTRAALYLAKGQMIRAANINATIFPMVFFLLYCGYFRYIKGTKVQGLQYAVILLVLFSLAVYGKGMIQYFPDKAPYVYQRNNVCARILPGYQEGMAQLLSAIREWRGRM